MTGPSRTALVTGASRGIGAATAAALAQAGHTVAGTWCHTEPGPRPEVTSWYRFDLVDGGGLDRLVDQIEADHGPVEVAVANAAVVADAGLARQRDEDLVAVVEADLVAAIRLTRRVGGAMAEGRWGRIVLVSSVSAAAGLSGQSAYAAAKAGLVGLARSAARELGPRQVTVNVVSPGLIDTDATARHRDRFLRDWAHRLPLARPGRAEEVAAVIAFLASDAAGAVTGAVLPVDGGFLGGAA